jgi:hypothetical protein
LQLLAREKSSDFLWAEVQATHALLMALKLQGNAQGMPADWQSLQDGPACIAIQNHDEVGLEDFRAIVCCSWAGFWREQQQPSHALAMEWDAAQALEQAKRVSSEMREQVRPQHPALLCRAYNTACYVMPCIRLDSTSYTAHRWFTQVGQLSAELLGLRARASQQEAGLVSLEAAVADLRSGLAAQEEETAEVQGRLSALQLSYAALQDDLRSQEQARADALAQVQAVLITCPADSYY